MYRPAQLSSVGYAVDMESVTQVGGYERFKLFVAMLRPLLIRPSEPAGYPVYMRVDG
jgi:hypothetical protein